MKIKKGANIQGIKTQMRAVFICADKIWLNLGQELVVTCGMDGEHSPGSWHYYGYAVDLRTRYFAEEDAIFAASMLQEQLGQDYDVVLHKSHIHVEYDRN